MVIAEPSRRILARAIEAALPSVGVLVSLGGGLAGSRALVQAGGGLFLALWLGVLAANAWLVTARCQTVGKGWLGLRIVRPDGGAPGFVRGFLMRELLLGLLTLVPVLGPLLALADAVLLVAGERRRSLHDVLADTLVIDTRGTG
jgi:uncharacterized RDD family membrane protein YckC